MRRQLKLLEDLQAIDLQLQQSEQALLDLPKKLHLLKANVHRIESILAHENHKLSETLSYKEGLEEARTHDKELIAKTLAKMSSVRTSKEYMATQREFETNRRLSGDREGELARLTEAITDRKNSIRANKEKLKELQQHVAEEEEATKRKLSEIEEAVAGDRAFRTEKATEIKRALLSRYDRIRKMRKGTAVVPVVEGVCHGCHMRLPPQLDIVLQQQVSIEQCPNCQRILFCGCNGQERSPTQDEGEETAMEGE